MNVRLVIPAFGRYAVSRLAFAGYAWLLAELAERGVTCRATVIADDDNLDLAASYGLDTLERPNVLGDKVNAGFQQAATDGADWVCFAGSDNWMHPDLFLNLDDTSVRTSDRLAMVDLPAGRATVLRRGLRQGLPPWLIPIASLARCGYQPIPAGEPNGIEGHLSRALVGESFRMRATADAAAVDFKTAENMTAYRTLRGYGDRERAAWPLLEDAYPADLVELARATREDLAAVAA